MRGAALAALLLCTACSHRSQVDSCADDLRGVWRPEDRPTERWMILDNRTTLEIYPLFPDAPSGSPETAPRVIDLARTGDDLRGHVKRRYMQRADSCLAKASVQVAACKGETLELVLADPLAPLTFAPCTWGTTAPSHRERWRRE